MKRSMVFAGVVGLLLLASAFSQEFPKAFPLGKVKRGMDCTGLTVFDGKTPKVFHVELIGFDQNPEVSDKYVVLAKMKNGTPVAEGMSGSPIYCQEYPGGKKEILGALAYSIGEFSASGQAALTGITPIQYMRGQGEVSGGGLPGPLEQANVSLPGDIHPIEMLLPVSVSGEASSRKPTSKLHAGDSVSMHLARGAVIANATCTVTEVTSKGFSACGHPFTRHGPVEFPASTGSILATFRSTRTSFKLVGVNNTIPVGTIVYDGPFGVLGEFHPPKEDLLSVHLSIQVDQGTVREKQFEVIRDPVFSSKIVNMALLALLKDNVWLTNKTGTASLTAKIFIAGRTDPFVIGNVGIIARKQINLIGTLAGNNTDDWEIFDSFRNALERIEQSPWDQALRVEKIDLVLQIQSGDHALSIKSMMLLGKNSQPTDEIFIGGTFTPVLIAQDGDGNNFGWKLPPITIPADFHPVLPDHDVKSIPAQLCVMSGSRYQEKDPKKIPPGIPNSPDEFLNILSINERPPSELYIVLVLPPERQTNGSNIEILKVLTENSWQRIPTADFLSDAQPSIPRVLETKIPLVDGFPKNGVMLFRENIFLKLMLK